MARRLSRREMLVTTGAALGAGTTQSAEGQGSKGGFKGDPFRYCLNTSTLRGHKLPLLQEVEIASKAGYSGIEPWIGEIEEYVKGGGTLKDLA